MRQLSLLLVLFLFACTGATLSGADGGATEDDPSNQEDPSDQDDPSAEEDEGSDDCLLYTSPSPRDATLSRMPSSA